MSGPPTRAGWVSERLREEFPGLGLTLCDVPLERRLGRSPKGVRERLALLADRFRGADAMVLRQRPVPHAYRVFFRHVGIDPDVTRVPVEAAALRRLVQGGFPSQGLLQDALTIALMETGVPLWALDAEAVDGRLGPAPERRARAAGGGDGRGGAGARPDRRRRRAWAGRRAVRPGRPRRATVGRKTTQRAAVRGRASTASRRSAVEEALWTCAETLLS